MKKILCGLIVVGMISGCSDPILQNESEKPEPEKAFALVDVMSGNAVLEDWHENNVITRVIWQKLKLSEACGEKYPALLDAFEKYNEESLTEAKAQMYELTPLAKEMEGEEYNPVYCGAEAKLYLQRADNHIVSFFEGVETYTGGIHPDYVVNGRNYSPETGAEVKLTEVLTDTKDLPSILEKKITEKYPGVTFFELEDTFSKYKPEEFTWTADYQGITFWFSPYEIAAYAVGTLSAKIWFDEYPELFNKAYVEAPSDYVMTLPVGHEIEFDLEGDGVKDTIYTEKRLDQYGSYNMLSVTVNGKTGTDEINYAYDFDVYLVHMDDKNYIYSDSTSDNDYHMFCTWDINGDTPKITQELYGTEMDYLFVEEGYETGTVYKQAFNHPESFVLETRFDILGTRGATAAYQVSKTDGTPEMKDGVYTFNYGHEVTTIIPLEAELLPDMEKTELPVGTSLTPYQTDGKSYVDLKTKEEQIVRLAIDESDWPRKVNGIPEDECFENLMYAG